MSNRTYPNISFVEFDADKILSEMISNYESETEMTVAAASPVRLLLSWLANIVTQIYANIDIAAKENVPRFAGGAKLDILTELFHNVSRKPASTAITTIQFNLSTRQESAQLIPAGTRVSTIDGKVTFETVGDIYIPAGELSAMASARCQLSGEIGNGYAPGQISRLVDVFPFYQECSNLTESAGGADVEDDASLYERMRESQDTYSTAGALGAYVYYAKSASVNITDVRPVSPSPGVVSLYVLMNDGSGPDTETVNAVLEAANADQTRAMTDYVQVLAPEAAEYYIDLTYYLPAGGDKSASVIEAEVNTAVDEYIRWQSGKIGRDINPSKLHDLIMSTGVKRVDIRSPHYQKLTDGDRVNGSVTPVQVATLTGQTVLNGGPEDE